MNNIKDNYRVADLDEILKYAVKRQEISIDTEWDAATSPTSGDKNFKIHGLSCAVQGEDTILANYFTDFNDVQAVLDAISDGVIEVPAHFAQSEEASLKSSGFKFKNDLIYRDTSIALNMLQEERSDKDLGLKKITPEFLGWELGEYCGDDMESDAFHQYAREDAVATLKLYQLFKPNLIKHNLWDVYELVCSSVAPFAEMTMSGVVWDFEVAEDIYEKLCDLRDGLKEEVYKLIGRVNLDSPKQLNQRLFKELKYTAKHLDRSKTTNEISTGIANMQKLAGKYPACEAISCYRTCEKMLSSMIEPYCNFCLSSSDDRIHARYSFASATGRTRCSKPNLQQIPRPGSLGKNVNFNDKVKQYLNDINIRSGFVAPKGYKWVIADYSSAEYHIAAIVCNDQKLIDLYCQWECKECGCTGYNNKVVRNCTDCGKPVVQGGDLHTVNMNIANAAGANISRGQAKAVSFLAIFNGGAWKLSKDLNLPVSVCEQILRDVLDEFPGIREWHKRTAKIADTTGEVRDMFNRRRKIDLKKLLKEEKDRSKHEWIRKNAINKLTNFPCQSPVSVICQIAMGNIRKRLIKENLYGTHATLQIMVHDSIGMYAKEEVADYILEVVLHEMENAVEMAVPMNADGGVYKNLAEEI